MAKVQFDGANKLIIVNNGETALDAKVDLYSDWKEWFQVNNNARFLQAFSVVGGDPLPGGRFLGSTFLLENDWKIRPYEGSHVLVVDGNLYSSDGSNVFVQTLGSYNVQIQMQLSSLVDAISTGGSALTAEEHTAVMGTYSTVQTTAADVITTLANTGTIINSVGQIFTLVQGVSGSVNQVYAQVLLVSNAVDAVQNSVTPILPAVQEVSASVVVVQSSVVPILPAVQAVSASVGVVQSSVIPILPAVQEVSASVGVVEGAVAPILPAVQAVSASVGQVSGQVQEVSGSVTTVMNLTNQILLYAADVFTDLTYLRAFQTGRWKIDTTTFQMIFYDEDNTTEKARFNLYDENGNPSFERVFERVKV